MNGDGLIRNKKMWQKSEKIKKQKNKNTAERVEWEELEGNKNTLKEAE